MTYVPMRAMMTTMTRRMRIFIMDQGLRERGLGMVGRRDAFLGSAS
jgi:hypothetical protein